MNPSTQHVVVVPHYDTVLGVDHLALIAFDVEDDARCILLFDDIVVPLRFIVRNREERSPERVGMDD